MPTLYVPHGGGPCFFMPTPPPLPADLWDGMAAYLRGIDAALGERPRAALVISAHWEAQQPTLNVAARPGLLFDYYGFPEYTYRLEYPAPGAPEFAERVRGLLAAAGLDSAASAERGFDHGVFVPFKLIYPDASVPILQLSLHASLDPAIHLQMGRALAPLRDAGVLIVATGMSYHNLGDLFSGRGNERAAAFDAWLGDAVQDPAARDAALLDWDRAPGARDAHPRAEHLIPLLVAAGAAPGERGVRRYHETLLGKPISGFQFG